MRIALFGVPGLIVLALDPIPSKGIVLSEPGEAKAKSLGDPAVRLVKRVE